MRGIQATRVQNLLPSYLPCEKIRIKICKTVVLCAFETLYLILKKENGMMVFKNRVLRRIFGPRRNEVIGGWKSLRNEELHNMYSSPNIIRMMKSRRMRWAGHVAHMKTKRNAYSDSLIKRAGCRWKNNIKN
jgi:hypothetical protein